MQGRLTSTLLGIVGAVVGGLLGYWAFFWIARQGFYALIVPGALMGLGCGMLARHRSVVRGVVCGLAGLGLGLYTDWGFEKFDADKSFAYFVAHVHQLQPVTLIMIAAGGLLSFWLGKDAGFSGRSEPAKTETRTSNRDT